MIIPFEKQTPSGRNTKGWDGWFQLLPLSFARLDAFVDSKPANCDGAYQQQVIKLLDHHQTEYGNDRIFDEIFIVQAGSFRAHPNLRF
jgi:hypothetical protein